MARPFAVIGFTMLAVLAALFFLPEWAVFIALGAFALGLALALLLRSSAVIKASFAAALLACILMLLQLANAYYPTLGQTGEQLQIRAQIISNAEQKYGRYYYTVRTVSINGNTKRLRLRLSSPFPIYARPYDEIAYAGKIYILGEDEPDRLDYYKASGLYLGSFAQSGEEDRVEIAHKRGFYPMRYVLQLQELIRGNLLTRYSAETGGLLQGMLLGESSALSWKMQETFRRAGISHLFAVSGLHMSLLAWSLYRALRGLRCPKRAATLVSMGFVVFFMALTGFRASCVRAGVMMLILLAGRLFNRRADSLNSLGFAAMLLMLANPFSAGQLGMELSFCATLGIILLQRRFSVPLRKSIRRLHMPKQIKRTLHAANEGLSVTAAALAFTMPVQLLRLESGVSMLTFVANLLFVPLSGIFIPLGGLSVAFQPLAKLTEPLGKLLERGVEWLDKIPAPVLQTNAVVAIPLGLCALVMAAALLSRYHGKPMKLRLSAGLVAVILLAGCWLPGFTRRNDVVVQRLKVGSGISILLSRGRRAALLGCGGDELPAGAAKRALSALGAGELELLLIPGKSEELSAGATELRKDVPMKQLIRFDDVAQQYTQFSLWEHTEGIFYCAEGNSACLIKIKDAQYTIIFQGTLPAEWQNLPNLTGDKAIGIY